jgi:hypothetical protein
MWLTCLFLMLQSQFPNAECLRFWLDGRRECVQEAATKEIVDEATCRRRRSRRERLAIPPMQALRDRVVEQHVDGHDREAPVEQAQHSCG